MFSHSTKNFLKYIKIIEDNHKIDNPTAIKIRKIVESNKRSITNGIKCIFTKQEAINLNNIEELIVLLKNQADDRIDKCIEEYSTIQGVTKKKIEQILVESIPEKEYVSFSPLDYDQEITSTLYKGSNIIEGIMDFIIWIRFILEKIFDGSLDEGEIGKYSTSFHAFQQKIKEKNVLDKVLSDVEEEGSSNNSGMFEKFEKMAHVYNLEMDIKYREYLSQLQTEADRYRIGINIALEHEQKMAEILSYGEQIEKETSDKELSASISRSIQQREEKLLEVEQFQKRLATSTKISKHLSDFNIILYNVKEYFNRQQKINSTPTGFSDYPQCIETMYSFINTFSKLPAAITNLPNKEIGEYEHMVQSTNLQEKYKHHTTFLIEKINTTIQERDSFIKTVKHQLEKMSNTVKVYESVNSKYLILLEKKGEIEQLSIKQPISELHSMNKELSKIFSNLQEVKQNKTYIDYRQSDQITSLLDQLPGILENKKREKTLLESINENYSFIFTAINVNPYIPHGVEYHKILKNDLHRSKNFIKERIPQYKTIAQQIIDIKLLSTTIQDRKKIIEKMEKEAAIESKIYTYLEQLTQENNNLITAIAEYSGSPGQSKKIITQRQNIKEFCNQKQRPKKLKKKQKILIDKYTNTILDQTTPLLPVFSRPPQNIELFDRMQECFFCVQMGFLHGKQIGNRSRQQNTQRNFFLNDHTFSVTAQNIIAEKQKKNFPEHSSKIQTKSINVIKNKPPLNILTFQGNHSSSGGKSDLLTKHEFAITWTTHLIERYGSLRYAIDIIEIFLDQSEEKIGPRTLGPGESFNEGILYILRKEKNGLRGRLYGND